MWINHVLLGLLGLLFGLSVASGSFALAVTLGIVPAMAERSSTASHIITYENTIILGGIFGNIISVFTQIKLPLGSVFLAVYGLGAGIFTGCMVVALAEFVDVCGAAGKAELIGKGGNKKETVGEERIVNEAEL